MRLERHIPDCRIRLEGQPLDLPVDAALVAAEVDLDDDLLGQCALLFIDRSLELTNGDRFQSGSKVKVEMGFGSALAELFDGEVTALEPQFRRDKPPALRVVCHEALHRLALSPMTRAFNDVDDRDIATAIAQEHGLSADAPQGTKTHVLQANVSDAQFLRRRARELGNRIRVEGTRLVMAPPDGGESGVTLRPGDGVKKLAVRVRDGAQVGGVSAHGWDPANKREISARVGDSGGTLLSIAGDGTLPPDPSTAESMARGRLRRIADQRVTAEVEMIGDARLVPGRLFDVDKVDDKLDGQYRVDHATHRFDRHGYRLHLTAARIKEKPPPPPAPRQVQPELVEELYNARFGRPDARHRDRVQLMVDARNLEGRTVYFRVEHWNGSEWEFFDELQGLVQGNHARAQLTVAHPATDHTRPFEEVGGARQLRLLASLQPGPRGADRGPQLVNARFGSERARHGEEVRLMVDARRADGRTVEFTVEHDRGDGSRETVATARATVQAGHASARVRVDHPGVKAAHGGAAGPAGERRFHLTARLVEE